MNNTHWITCKTDLEKWVIFIYDSFTHRSTNDPQIKEKAIIPFRTFLLVIMKQMGFFNHLALRPRNDIFRAVRLPPEDVAQHDNDDSCDMFSLTFMEYILQGKPIHKSFGQQDIYKLRLKKAREIFANGIDTN